MTGRVLIIADDLTGALDSGCAFAARGHATRVLLDPGDLPATLAQPQISIIAVATGTRELSATKAARVVLDIAGKAAGFDGIVFKKIDSRIKGNIAAELGAVHAVFPRRVLAAPAVPRLGRYVTGGCVTGAGVETPIPIRPALGRAAEVPDTTSAADLDAALPDDLSKLLYVGAAGLAEALAHALPSGKRKHEIRLDLPLLMAIGSRDPVTLSQISSLSIAPIAAPNGIVPPLSGDQLSLVQLTQGHATVSGQHAAQEFATGIAHYIHRQTPATLFACGGETAHAILDKIGIKSLDLLGEIFPGTPISRTLNGDLTVLTKSGGFGETDLLDQLIRKFVKS